MLLAVLAAFEVAQLTGLPPRASPRPGIPTPPVSFSSPGEYFEIVNSGSSNVAGYRVYVARDGRTFTVTGAQGSAAAPGQAGKIDTSLAARVFADLAQLSPFPPAAGVCMRSVSFSSVTRVAWRGTLSPPIDCPKDPAYAALREDVAEIVRALKPPAVLFRRPIGPLPSAPP